MRPPIFVFAGGDVDIFESVEDAVRYIEWPSVVEERTVAYDSEGRLLKLEAPGERATGLLGVKAYSVSKPITITSAEVEPSHQDELASQFFPITLYGLVLLLIEHVSLSEAARAAAAPVAPSSPR